MIKRCKYCNSIWVCWDWIQEPKTGLTLHECWKCDNTFTTDKIVWNGIPYKVLCRLFRYFNRGLNK